MAKLELYRIKNTKGAYLALSEKANGRTYFEFRWSKKLALESSWEALDYWIAAAGQQQSISVEKLIVEKFEVNWGR
jgi:hypothetical protein